MTAPYETINGTVRVELSAKITHHTQKKTKVFGLNCTFNTSLEQTIQSDCFKHLSNANGSQFSPKKINKL